MRRAYRLMNRTKEVKKKVHPNSLANLDKGRRSWKPGQSGNPKGRPRDPIRLARDRLNDLFFSEYWVQNKKKQEETIVLMLKAAIEAYMKAEGTEKQRWYELIVGSSTGAAKNSEQSNNSGINAQNVIILPALRETKVLNADKTEFEVIE